MAFLGQESQWAGEASECAGDQEAFWEFHDQLFNSQAGENRGAFNKENLKKLTGEFNLDQEMFDECLDSGKYADFVRDQTSLARQFGVQSTPSFMINGQVMIGAQPFEAFRQVIEQLLSGSQP